MNEYGKHFAQSLLNAYAIGLRKHFYEILKDKAPAHKDIVEKITSQVTTERDFEEVGGLIVAIYEAGFASGVRESRGMLEKLGYKVQIVSKPTSESDNASSRIFKQKSPE